MLMSSDKAVYSFGQKLCYIYILCILRVKIEFIKFYMIKFEILKRIKILKTSY